LSLEEAPQGNLTKPEEMRGSVGKLPLGSRTVEMVFSESVGLALGRPRASSARASGGADQPTDVAVEAAGMRAITVVFGCPHTRNLE